MDQKLVEEFVKRLSETPKSPTPPKPSPNWGKPSNPKPPIKK